MLIRRPPRHGEARKRPGTFARVRALFAGALVLGVGATATLAAWTDQEVATGSFTAGTFGIESNVSGAVWSEHPAAPGATLSFDATAMYPGSVNYAPLNIRTTPQTTVQGVVQLATATKIGPLADVLEYRAVRSAATCGPNAFDGSPTWVAGDASAWVDAGAMPLTTPPSIQIAAGGAETHQYCFALRLKNSAGNQYQGTTGTATWSFLATSASN